ncbi:MAG TPA: hypothetical protein VJV78_14075 [Polyangiales bacterium]|nr:hypothetical protein [Polyangiales bacterium]
MVISLGFERRRRAALMQSTMGRELARDNGLLQQTLFRNLE